MFVFAGIAFAGSPICGEQDREFVHFDGQSLTIERAPGGGVTSRRLSGARGSRIYGMNGK
jgi:hypothetical protein